MLAVHKGSETGYFTQLSNSSFCSLSFHKRITSEAHLLFKSIQSFMQISEMQKKNGENIL